MGFEPTDACTSPVFKTGALNRSATHPSTALLQAERVLCNSVWQAPLITKRVTLPTGRAAAAMNDAGAMPYRTDSFGLALGVCGLPLNGWGLVVMSALSLSAAQRPAAFLTEATQVSGLEPAPVQASVQAPVDDSWSTYKVRLAALAGSPLKKTRTISLSADFLATESDRTGL